MWQRLKDSIIRQYSSFSENTEYGSEVKYIQGIEQKILH